MDLNREKPQAGPVVTGFAGRGLKVGELTFAEGLWLDPARAMTWPGSPPRRVSELTAAMIAPLVTIDPAPEFLLLGTGERLVRPPRPFVLALEAQGIGVEAMDSRAAAKAWGVLRQEERWIVAALMAL